MKSHSSDGTWVAFKAAGFGTGHVCVSDDHVLCVWLPGSNGEKPAGRSEKMSARRAAFAKRVVETIEECYRSGADTGHLPVQMDAEPDSFRCRVLEACARIPHGETRSYQWLAAEAGSPRATRAAGNVMATNSIAIIIPCHRVVRADGSLGNFGGGVKMKARLLELERG
jgi:O-6-methylguanine DNA methyltransferase